jgi:Contractile injection system tube protein/LysM domain
MGTATITEWNLSGAAPVAGGVSLTVDFDPKSLQLTYTPIGRAGAAVTAAPGAPAVNNAPAQQTGQSSTLALDLTFDTSVTGGSVQVRTDQLVNLTVPAAPGQEAPPLKVVRFHWGSFLFTGMVQSLSQTIDFFSDAGVPLRAQVHLALSEVKPPNPDAQRPPASAPSSFGANAGVGAGVGFSAGIGVGGGFSASASLSAGAGASFGASAGVSASFGAAAGVGTVPLTLSHAGDTLQSITARAGAGVSWKAVAAANGIENPRLLPPGTVLATTGLTVDARAG